MKTSRKDFLKSTALVGLGAISLGTKAKTIMDITKMQAEGMYKLPLLGYEYNALEPFIDAKTMEIHYTKHHQAYINKLNDAMEKEPSLKAIELEKILKDLKSQPESVRAVLRNHGGGHWNHSLFWTLLKTNTQPGAKFTKLATESFGSLDAFKKDFEKASMGIFGSGWSWVIIQNGKLKIVSTPNQDNPLMEGIVSAEQTGLPIIALDVWEHAYYLKYQNKRADYIAAFWNVLNWDQVEKNMI